MKSTENAMAAFACKETVEAKYHQDNIFIGSSFC